MSLPSRHLCPTSTIHINSRLYTATTRVQKHFSMNIYFSSTPSLQFIPPSYQSPNPFHINIHTPTSVLKLKWNLIPPKKEERSSILKEVHVRGKLSTYLELLREIIFYVFVVKNRITIRYHIGSLPSLLLGYKREDKC